MLKCQFHIHVTGDPEHIHSYTAEDLIERAQQLKYDVLSITCHKKVIFSHDLQSFAKEHGILLIPGIELEIKKKHILVINPTFEIEQVDTFEKLREYKKDHPEIFIIAPHPFFPGKSTLKDKLIENIDIFDAIEHSFCYTTSKNYNKKALAIAAEYHKPVVATSDVHMLSDLDLGYTEVDAQKNIQAIFSAIKQNQIKISHSPISYFRIFKTIFFMDSLSLIKKIARLFKRKRT